MLLSLHPNIIVHVENVLSLFSSPSTSSQKVRKCGGHKFLSQAIECGQLVSSSLLDRILVNFYIPLLLSSTVHVCMCVYVCGSCFHTAIPEDMIQEPDPPEDDPDERIPRMYISSVVYIVPHLICTMNKSHAPHTVYKYLKHMHKYYYILYIRKHMHQ